MARALLFFFTLLLTLSVRAQTVVPLDIGGARLRVEMPTDYVRVSERSPAYLTHLQAMLPPDNVMIEALMSPDDMLRQLKGKPAQSVAYQIQTMRALERVAYSKEDWRKFRPQLVEQIGTQDMAALTSELERGAQVEIGRMSGGRTTLRLGEIGKPVLYGRDIDTVRFSMVLPISVQTESSTRSGRVVLATIVAVVSERLVILQAGKVVVGDEVEELQRVGEAIDAFHARLLALNAAATP